MFCLFSGILIVTTLPQQLCLWGYTVFMLSIGMSVRPLLFGFSAEAGGGGGGGERSIMPVDISYFVRYHNYMYR